MTTLLVDTDIAIDYLRGLDASRRFFKSSVGKSVLYVSVITIAELHSGKGISEPRKAKELEQFLSNFEIAIITPAIAKAAGEIRREFSRPFADMLIAATALQYGFSLATRNLKDFQRLPKLKVIKPY